MAEDKILVTSALPYANGPIHFGHIAGAYLPADIFVRYKKMTGADVIYICGSDDHGVAITISAEKAGVTPEEHVAKNHKIITDTFDRMNIRFDNFSGTGRKPHHEMSQTFFRRIHEQGYIDKRTTKQLFCTHDNMFLADRYVAGTCPYCGFEGARGDECPGCGKWLDPLEIKKPTCKVCGNPPEVRETTNWYLLLDKLEPKLKEWIGTKGHWKENVLNFVQGWFTEGLHERAITRDMSWGIPVPLEEAEGKVLYVWFDAPIGYVSSTVEWAEAQGEPEKWRDYWCNPSTRLIHFIGKDNIPFHCIVFPSMIMAQNEANEDKFVLPENVPANEFYNLEGRQFSKSEGWYVDLDDFFEKYKVDSIRYTLCANMPEKKDSEFTWKEFQTRNNSDLADTYGNLANRVLRFTGKNFDGQIPECGPLDAEDSALLVKIKAAPKLVGDNLETFEYRRAIYEVMELAREGNRFFDKREPWATVKSDKALCGTTLHLCFHLLKSLAVISCPFIPDSAQKLWELIGCEGKVEDVDWSTAPAVAPISGSRFPEPEILFTKLEDKQIDGEVEKLKKWAEEAAASDAPREYAPVKETIEFPDFTKIDLRVATIVEAEPIKKSKKLLKLQVDLGFEKRQVVAGISPYFKPEELLGKRVVVVANLKPAKLMGVESNGMVLAVIEDGRATLLTTLAEAFSGSLVS
jgi:methionyl-tRNA synthetase